MKLWDNLRESVLEIEQVATLRQKFQELDQRMQNIVLGSIFGSLLAIALALLGFFAYSCFSLRSDIRAMEASIGSLKQSSAKLEDLRRQIREQNNDPLARDIDPNLPLAQLVEKAAQKSAIGKGAIEIAPLAAASVNEFALELKLNKISLRQLSRILFFFENAKLGIAVNKLDINARDDREGYLWTSLSLSKQNGKAK